MWIYNIVGHHSYLCTQLQLIIHVYNYAFQNRPLKGAQFKIEDVLKTGAFQLKKHGKKWNGTQNSIFAYMRYHVYMTDKCTMQLVVSWLYRVRMYM